MPKLTLQDGGELYYEVQGSGPPLALVPGLAGLGAFWQPHVAALAEQFTVITHDHRGCGQSSITRIDYSVEQMADDVIQLLDHLGIERTHFMGHSTGGAIGQTLALDRPERIGRLVLSATWPRSDAYFRLLFELRAQVLREIGRAAYLRASVLFRQPPWWLREHPEAAAIDEAEARRRLPDPEVTLRRIAAIKRFDRHDDLHRIDTPTLVIVARDDAITPPYFSEQLGRLIPNAQTVILPYGGHFFPQISIEDYRRAVLGFLLG